MLTQKRMKQFWTKWCRLLKLAPWKWDLIKHHHYVKQFEVLQYRQIDMEYQNNNGQQQRTLITNKGKFSYTYNCSSSKFSSPSNDIVTTTAKSFSLLASTRQLTQLYSNSRQTATRNSQRLTRLHFTATRTRLTQQTVTDTDIT